MLPNVRGDSFRFTPQSARGVAAIDSYLVAVPNPKAADMGKHDPAADWLPRTPLS